MGMSPNATPILDFWFDFASTYSYPAAMLIEDRAKAAGVSVRWRPILLGPIFAAQGWDDSPFNIFPAKGRYMWRDMERLCTEVGLPFQRPNIFPQRSVDAAKLALYGLEQDWGPDFIRAVFTEQFVKGQDIANHMTLERALFGKIGQHPHAISLIIEAALNGSSRLRTETEAARALGIFGAPSFSIGAELFWGFDRMDQALSWATM